MNTFMSAFASADAWRAWFFQYKASLEFQALMYLGVTGVLWLVLHVFLRRRLEKRLIGKWPSARDLRRELSYSVFTLLIYAALVSAVLVLIMTHRVEVYSDIDRYGLAWGLLSLPAMIVWHDLYFYATHRLLHKPWLFRYVHAVHHRSRHPSPFGSYCFHPVEALINGLYVPLALLLVPIPAPVLFLAGLHQMLRNALGHSSVELMPAGFIDHKVWRYITTTTHHHLHHEAVNGNYGLWFTWCDRVLGTELPQYRQRFGQAAGG